MSKQYAAFLRQLLAPLGVYDLAESTINGAAVEALGAALDDVFDTLEEVERECLVSTAEDIGLSRRAGLFAHAPASANTEQLRAAIASLMRVGSGTLNLQEVNATISGCGIRACAAESQEPGHILVWFPDVIGQPDHYRRIQQILLEILPCHLALDFCLVYMTWAECEAQCFTWQAIEDAAYDWEHFQCAVPDKDGGA